MQDDFFSLVLPDSAEECSQRFSQLLCYLHSGAEKYDRRLVLATLRRLATKRHLQQERSHLLRELERIILIVKIILPGLNVRLHIKA